MMELRTYRFISIGWVCSGKADRKEVEDAKKSPIVFDEDCPELSPAMVKAFKRAVIQRNRRKKV